MPCLPLSRGLHPRDPRAGLRRPRRPHSHPTLLPEPLAYRCFWPAGRRHLHCPMVPRDRLPHRPCPPPRGPPFPPQLDRWRPPPLSSHHALPRLTPPYAPPHPPSSTPLSPAPMPKPRYTAGPPLPRNPTANVAITNTETTTRCLRPTFLTSRSPIALMPPTGQGLPFPRPAARVQVLHRGLPVPAWSAPVRGRLALVLKKRGAAPDDTHHPYLS